MMCLLESHTRLSSSIWWPKLRVARISDYSLSNISVAFVHARTDEGMFCEKAFRYQEFKIWATQGSCEWNEKSIKALARVLMRQARDKKKIFQRKDINPCIYKRFCSTATIFWFV